jgi:hypothetical protein
VPDGAVAFEMPAGKEQPPAAIVRATRSAIPALRTTLDRVWRPN